MTNPHALEPKPDCEICGRPYYAHNMGGGFAMCPVYATYRPKRSLTVDDAVIERLKALCKANNDLARMNRAEADRYKSERDALLDAVEYAHSEGFEWPADPIPSSLRTPLSPLDAEG